MGIDDVLNILVILAIFIVLIYYIGGYAVLCLIGIVKGKEYILRYVFRLQPLNCMDYLFLHDSNESRANIMGKLAARYSF